MAGRIEIVFGDLFDGPCDLVVIPCSTIPTITRFVAKRLRNFDIPRPDAPIGLGRVAYCDLRHASSIAAVAAYAASVEPGGGSSIDVITRIGTELGRYAHENAFARVLTAPLVGSGAGGLDPVAAARALVDGFLSAAPDDALLRIAVIDEELCFQLQTQLIERGSAPATPLREADRPLRVFISYTRSSPAHNECVVAIGTSLRTNGIDARLDVWHLRPGMDVAQWMCNELELADRVVIVCDETYRQKADGRHGGVGWEVRLIQGDLLLSQAANPDKYVPVVVTDTMDRGLPAFLRGVYGIHWPAGRADPSKTEELVRAIYRAYEQAPPLGAAPAFVLRRA